MNEYLNPADEQESEKINNDVPGPDKQDKHQKGTLETEGPDKDRDYKVLHKDGSLADRLPDEEAAGSGALDGMVGRGT
ncbi:MAG: hypothetical protein JST19_10335 [Bacteroidetes bacterium]|nr:hypothetical protein [Bacteroidota bacterium]